MSYQREPLEIPVLSEEAQDKHTLFLLHLSKYVIFKICAEWRKIGTGQGFDLRWHWVGIPSKAHEDSPIGSSWFGFATQQEAVEDFIRQNSELNHHSQPNAATE